jgi:CrcB protein
MAVRAGYRRGCGEGSFLMTYLWVAIGGALGSMARYGFSGAIARIAGGTFPFGTLFVNVTGAILIGFFAAMSLPEGRFLVPPPARMFLMTGICGGYTTFSTFSLETFNLMRGGDWIRALGNVALSVALCIIAVWIGFAAAMALNRAGAP